MGETHLEFYKRWGALAAPYFEWQFEQFKPYIGNRVADVGCGLGNFVPFLRHCELYLGFEPDGELASEFRALHASGAVQLARCASITDSRASAEMKEHRIDSVLCVNVLEHIQDDRSALVNIVEGVSCGGHICLLVPALSWLYGTLDRLDGHWRRYERRDLEALVVGLPLDTVRLYYMNLPGVLGWFLKGRVLKSKEQASADYRMMNRLLPLISRLEKLIPPPIGMSLVMILRKR